MKMMRRLGLTLAVLLLACAANAAQVVTVSDVMDYTDNFWDEDTGVWFIIPDEILDHSPWHRTSNQDWGWLHDVSSRVPLDATGIESATLSILAWDVDSDEGEDDVILVNSRYLGELTGIDRDWKTVTFDLPASVLNDLWSNPQLYVYMDIDQMLDPSNGCRVTVKSSTLTIKYNTSGTAPTTTPVHRFWSPVTGSHFYTIDEAERDKLIREYPDAWTYEGIAYRTLLSAGSTAARPIHRFWSPTLGGHFYTIDEAEKDALVANYPDVWTYEGAVFYAFLDGERPTSTMPVYRFWSPILGHHFFTMNEAEKDSLIATYPDVWTYEGISWYAFVE